MNRLILSVFFVVFIVSCSPSLTSDSAINPATVIPPAVTSLPTSVPLPGPSPTPEYPVRDGGALQTSAAVISQDNLSQLTELAVWGKGVIKGIKWSEDGGQIFVDTALGRYVYDSTAFQLVEEGLEFSESDSNLTFNVEDLGSSTDSTGHLKKQYRVQIFSTAPMFGIYPRINSSK